MRIPRIGQALPCGKLAPLQPAHIFPQGLDNQGNPLDMSSEL